MMWLQAMEVEEISEEGAGGESESTLEVSEEDNPLVSTRIGHELGAGSTPLDLGRHLAGANQSLDGTDGDRGALPAPAAGLGGISPGRHGACGRKEKEDEERKSSGERLPRRRSSSQVRGRSRSRARRRSCERNGEFRAEQQCAREQQAEEEDDV